MSQIDTFDPKGPGDAQTQKPGSYYAAIPTATSGVEVCEHLHRTAKLMEHVTAIRTVHHDVVDEHAAAVLRVHTGRPTSGTIQYPSIGSIIASERGPVVTDMPAYVFMGYPSPARDPGFLGTRGGYVYLTDHEKGPVSFRAPWGMTEERLERRQKLLDTLRRPGIQNPSSPSATLRAYNELIAESYRLRSGPFMQAFQLANERDSVRELYGEGFGQRCLVGRRLLERGVRFIEISHNMNFSNGTGWDTHGKGQLKQHVLIQELDQALAALIVDLQASALLDRTLIVVATEFGRPAQFDGQGGRGHHGKAFTMVLAGGGLNHRGAYGQTDELAMEIVEDPVSVPDFHATILATLGMDHLKNLFAANDRPVPVTDHGRPIVALFG